MGIEEVNENVFLPKEKEKIKELIAKFDEKEIEEFGKPLKSDSFTHD